MQKDIRLYGRFFCTAILLVLLSIASAHARPLQVADDGRPAAPRRIVCLVPAVTEILFAIDAGDPVLASNVG